MNVESIDYYIKIQNSPRSIILPKHYNLKVIDFVFNISFSQSFGLLPFRLLKERIDDLPNDSLVMIEYSGNIFLNFWIIFYTLKNRNKLILDCHNSAVEFEKGHYSRYVLNSMYLIFLNQILSIEMVIHNDFIKPVCLKYFVIKTPYPIFNFKDSVKKEIDILFLCSLNDDEPVELIVNLCAELKSRGVIAKITGDYKKVENDYMPDFFFDLTFHMMNTSIL